MQLIIIIIIFIIIIIIIIIIMKIKVKNAIKRIMGMYLQLFVNKAFIHILLLVFVNL